MKIIKNINKSWKFEDQNKVTHDIDLPHTWNGIDVKVLKYAMKHNKPLLGICAGMQSMNVAMGGTLIQDIETEINTNIEHRQGKRTLTEIAHYIDVIDKNSFLFKATEEEHFGITSNHHQAIKKLGDGFKITALSSEDKIVEAIEFEGDSFCVGIQWHPERYATDNDKKIIQHFFKMC